MRKLVFVVFWLEEEATKADEREVEKTIREEIERGKPIPYLGQLDKVTVKPYPE